ncbi:aminotransferase class V-fold PLP-dependent enzyme [Arthrobacter sp. MSA 4-2]|uniref:kynureninase n=1 Tax=Arthrobacter sp. MSA 4-2 TaxID=2794349 RepID=UPI0018E7C49D|nr:aminotransferase class V-fold PLP-dependent enzyme [Arthrobacter sp. MSA 4-2]MBJ2121531.1 aminotransferase class V-fold PLP-dependent enzyme [Arthrobacter sp. MSA 4-2]
MADDPLLQRARELDDKDPLAGYRDLFITDETDGIAAYLDGNSLGRPLAATEQSLADFVRHQWGSRLIRGWDEGWLELPERIGDRLGSIVLGAAPGQCIVADSTSVLLYKLARAAVSARPGRTEIVIDRDNFPTDRFLMEAIARERGLTVRWLEVPYDGGASAEAVAGVVGPSTALVVLSHVAYRSAHAADVPGITSVVHDAGALVLWDLSHSVGSVPLELDAWGVDYAAGCSYKYLNGGPGAPAWAYVAARHLDSFDQPIQGWLGSAYPFAMGGSYEPAPGIRRIVSGTPPILGMLALQDMLDVLEKAGIGAVREKSVALTGFAIEAVDALLGPAGVVVASPRAPGERGGHITIDHPAFATMVPGLWEQGIIPDYRNPSGIRLGLSPLTTLFEETLVGIRAIADRMVVEGAGPVAR